MLTSQVPGLSAALTITIESRKAHLALLESSILSYATPFGIVLMDSLRTEIAQYEKMQRLVG